MVRSEFGADVPEYLHPLALTPSGLTATLTRVRIGSYECLFGSDLCLLLQYCRPCYFFAPLLELGALCHRICSFSATSGRFFRHEYPEECNICIDMPLSLIPSFLTSYPSLSPVLFSSSPALAAVLSMLVNVRAVPLFGICFSPCAFNELVPLLGAGVMGQRWLAHRQQFSGVRQSKRSGSFVLMGYLLPPLPIYQFRPGLYSLFYCFIELWFYHYSFRIY